MNDGILEQFLRAYIACALWSSTDENGDHLDGLPNELAPETQAVMRADCEKFINENLLTLSGCGNWDQHGHDFWLTRNGHGAGFWDRDYLDEAGDELTLACKKFKEIDLYIGDDGLIYG